MSWWGRVKGFYLIRSLSHRVVTKSVTPGSMALAGGSWAHAQKAEVTVEASGTPFMGADVGEGRRSETDLLPCGCRLRSWEAGVRRF